MQDYLEPLQGEDYDDHFVPNYEDEFMSSKLFLQKASGATGDNLYNTKVLILIMFGSCKGLQVRSPNRRSKQNFG